MDDEGRGLDARLLRVRGVKDLDLVTVTLSPAQIHPQQHLGEVSRVDATSLRTDGDDSLTLVVLTGQQRTNLESVDILTKLGRLTRRLRQGLCVIAVSCEL